MRKIATISAFAVCAIASPALADDGDASWTGAYVGVNAGYTDAKSDQSVAIGGSWATEATSLQDFVTGFYPSQAKSQNVNYGGQLGYNMQTSSGLVVGLEADVSGLSGKESTVRGPTAPTAFPTLTYTVANTFDPKVTYGVKAKVGFASGKTMFYATGGWGWTSADIAVDISSNNGYHKTAAFSHTFNGWEAGAGIEQRFGSNMSLRLEYVYTDQGHVTYTTGYASGSAFAPPAFNYTETFTQDLTMHLVRLGVNFHF